MLVLILTAISTDFDRLILLVPLMIFLSFARGYLRFIICRATPPSVVFVYLVSFPNPLSCMGTRLAFTLHSLRA